MTHRIASKNDVSRIYGIRRFPLRQVALLSLFLWILSFVFSTEKLPDYDSYKRIYESVTSSCLFEWEPFFARLNYLGKYFLLSYDEFRQVILFLSLANFVAALYIFSRKLEWAALQCRKQSMIFTLGFVFAFAFAIFFFEFFIIRIRAGLSLAMVFLAFSLFWPGRKKTSKLKFIVVVILLGLAFATHLWTAGLLVYFGF